MYPQHYTPSTFADTLVQVRHPLANSPNVIFPPMPDHNLSTSQRMVRPTVHDPFFPAESLYEAEANSGRSGTVTSAVGSGCPPEFGLGIDYCFNGRHFTTPVYQLTHDTYAFHDATLTATIEGTASPQDSFQSAANDSVAISPRIPGLDTCTTKWESTVLPVAHDPSLTPTGHRSYIPLPMRRHKVIIVDHFFQPAMSSGALGEHMADDLQSTSIQFHQAVGKAPHSLQHVNSRHWECIW